MSRSVSRIQNLVRNEVGSINTVSMLLCIIAIAAYLKGGKEALEAQVPAFYHILLLILLGVVTIFTVGCELHVLLLGEKSARQIRRELSRQLKRLARFTKSSRERINAIEGRAEYTAGLLRPNAYENMSHLKQLLTGLERRITKVHGLIQSNKKQDVYEAASLIGAELSPFESCTDSLIDSRPLPPLEADQWIPTVEQLLSSLEFEAVRAMSKSTKAA